jgi:hypothetical protein
MSQRLWLGPVGPFILRIYKIFVEQYNTTMRTPSGGNLTASVLARKKNDALAGGAA